MSFKRDMLLGVSALVAILLLVCVGSIGLFTRMIPAIQEALRANDVSRAATDEMFGVLSTSSFREPSLADKRRFHSALDRVRGEVTGAEGGAEVDIIAARCDAAMDGDAQARSETVAALLRLVEDNRGALHHVLDDVQRLGWAGAWATGILSLLGFGAALVITKRIDRRIAHPIAELHSTLDAALAGDAHRRCMPSGAQNEIGVVMQSVNALLDRSAVPETRAPGEDEILRAAVVSLLDDEDRARFLLNGQGHIVAASHAGLARLDGTDGRRLRRALDAAAGGEVAPPILECVDLGEGGRLCALGPGSERPPAVEGAS